MGLEERINLALSKLALRDRDCLLLCSDGLTGVISEEEIRATILSARKLEDAATKLLNMVRDRKGGDDVTLILAGIGGFLKAPREDESVESTHEVISSFDPKKKKKPTSSSS
jgi:serine/threonine protein phosphatase PrpC